MEKLPFHHDAAADAGAQGNEHHILRALAAALPVFAKGGHIGVVAGLHREARQAAEGLGDVEYPPAQVDTAVDHALGADGTGDADAQAQDGTGVDLVVRYVAADGRGDVGKNLGAAAGRHRGDFPLAQHFAGLVKIGDLDGGAAQVDAESVFHK